jgi:hypothetical protein
LQEATAEELTAIQRQRLHTTFNASGWSALHYAAAAHKVKLVQQLLELGADAADAVYGLTPMHLACMGRVKDKEQLDQLTKACESLYDLQVGCCSFWIVSASVLLMLTCEDPLACCLCCVELRCDLQVGCDFLDWV